MFSRGRARTLQYVALPALVFAGIAWKGTHHYKTWSSWPTHDVLLNVQVFHRHGDRVPATLLRDDRAREDSLWSKRISKTYSTLRSQSGADGTVQLFSKENIKLNDIYQWKHIAKRLNGSFMIYSEDNYDAFNKNVIVSSKHTDPQTATILSKLKSWDSKYTPNRNRAYWSGQLTDKGVNAMFGLGTWLRQRYCDELAFLSPTYANDTIHYISNNFARCIESADSLLQGLYPLKHRAEGHSIPIHCDYRDCWLCPNPHCKRSRRRQRRNEDALRSTEDENMITLKRRLCDWYGIKDRHWIAMCESLLCRLHHDLDLPPSEQISEDELKAFIDYVATRTCKFHCLDSESMKLSTGVLLDKLLTNMKRLENKFVVYSAHDGTLQRLLVALSNGRQFDFAWPAYNATLIFEVWQKSITDDKQKESFMMSVMDWIYGVDHSRSKYVRILYEGHPLRIDGDEFVPISTFDKMWANLI